MTKPTFVDFGGTADLVISEMAFVHIFHPNEEGFENAEYRVQLENWITENNVSNFSYDREKYEKSDNESSGMIDCPILNLMDTQRTVTVIFNEPALKGVDIFMKNFSVVMFDTEEAPSDKVEQLYAIIERFPELSNADFNNELDYMWKVHCTMVNAMAGRLHERLHSPTGTPDLVALCVAVGLSSELTVAGLKKPNINECVQALIDFVYK